MGVGKDGGGGGEKTHKPTKYHFVPTGIMSRTYSALRSMQSCRYCEVMTCAERRRFLRNLVLLRPRTTRDRGKTAQLIKPAHVAVDHEPVWPSGKALGW